MIDMAVIIALAVFVATLLFLAGFAYYMQYAMERRKMGQRLKEDVTIPEGVEVEGGGSYLALAKEHFLHFIRRTGNLLTPRKTEEDLSHLEKTFLKAGYRDRNVVPLFWGAKASTGIPMLIHPLPAGSGSVWMRPLNLLQKLN